MQWELRLFILRNGIDPGTLKAFHAIPRQGPREQTAPDAEVEAVLRIASNRLKLAIYLARDAGLRRSAIEKMTAANVDFDNNEVFGVTKNNARYRVPMTHRLRDMLAGVVPFAKRGEELIATLSRDRRRVKACTLLWEMRATQDKAGGQMAWSMHDLRRTGARELYDRTHDVRKVQRFLGHSSPVATWWYLGNIRQPLSAADLEPTTESPKTERKSA